MTVTTATKRSPRRNGTKPVKARDICLLGYAEETREMVFGLPEEVNIWGINAAHYFTHNPRDNWKQSEKLKAKVTDWFQVHPSNWVGVNKASTGYWGRPVEHLEFLKNFEGNVWMMYPEDGPAKEIPNRRQYPLEEIVKGSRDHFTSTFAYQLGLAWYQHTQLDMPIERLRCYGINLTSMDEYIHQKSCVEYWLGRLEQAGVEVEIPNASALLKGKRYGSSGDMSDHVMERLQHVKARYMEAHANLTTALSLKADTQFWASILSEIATKFPESFTEDMRKALQAEFDARMAFVNGLAEKSSAEINGHHGQIKTEQHYLALFGGVDHRAPAMPEIRIPGPMLSKRVEMPKQMAI